MLKYFGIPGSKKCLFLLILVGTLVNFAYGDDVEIQMDWLIEGQSDTKQATVVDKELTVSPNEDKVISDHEPVTHGDLEQSDARPTYEKFVTGNGYSVGEYNIAIDSEEGQMLNHLVVEQQKLQKESFKHKIKYYDRFSDGYVEIAQALLDPIGDNRYLINGRAMDYNPNSNLELFVLERGYSLDNLEAIPNDIFTPKEFTLGRAMLVEAVRSGEGDFDLREYSPNHLHLNKAQIQDKMINSFQEQASQIFDDILIDEKSLLDGTGDTPNDALPNPEITAALESSKNMFDDFNLEQPKFEDTRHVRDSIQTNPFRTDPAKDPEDMLFLLTVSVIAGGAVLGLLLLVYILKRNTHKKILESHPLQVIKSTVNYTQHTKNMLSDSLNCYDSNRIKDAYEILGKAIRYYLSHDLGIQKEMTNLELLDILEDMDPTPLKYRQVKEWLLLCGSVEYAKYKSHDSDFRNALSRFTQIIS